jgi:hypothetical protein
MNQPDALFSIKLFQQWLLAGSGWNFHPDPDISHST